MAYIDQIIVLEKCLDGMSPAEVYQCQLDNKICYLKKIDTIFAQTTYSVKREAEMMLWLSDKLMVPAVIEYGTRAQAEYLLMSALKGKHINCFVDQPEKYIEYLAKAIRQLQAIDISNCPFSSQLDFRLKELKYLLDHNLADVDSANWDPSTTFTQPLKLYQWLCQHRPPEELCFSHGDVGANFLVAGDDLCFYDLARCGIADKWVNIAFCVRDIREYFPNSDYEKLFFERLELEPNYEKINYYILLDEMF